MIISFALAKVLYVLAALATLGSGVYFLRGIFAERPHANNAWVLSSCAKRYYMAYLLQTVALVLYLVADWVK